MQFQSSFGPIPSQFDPKRNQQQQAGAANFQITQHAPGNPAATPQTTALNHHSMQTQMQAPLVNSMQSPLSGSASEVFNRARVISFTEPTRAELNFRTENTDFKNTLVMYKLAGD